MIQKPAFGRTKVDKSSCKPILKIASGVWGWTAYLLFRAGLGHVTAPSLCVLRMGFVGHRGSKKMFASPKNVFYDTYDAIQSITVVALFGDKSLSQNPKKLK